MGACEYEGWSHSGSPAEVSAGAADTVLVLARVCLIQFRYDDAAIDL